MVSSRVSKTLGLGSIPSSSAKDIINRHKEEVFLNAVKEGVFEIFKDGKVIRKSSGKILTNSKIKKGNYRTISMTKDGKRLVYPVHRLIFISFGGLLTEEFPFINHKDGNKLNNCFDNLEPSNYEHNRKHAYSNNLMLPVLGSENGASVLNEKQVKEIKIKLKSKSRSEIALEYGVCYMTISNIDNEKTWKNISPV